MAYATYVTLFDTEDQALELIAKVKDVLKLKGALTVSDYLMLSWGPNNRHIPIYSDSKYGWVKDDGNRFGYCKLLGENHGAQYRITMPEPHELHPTGFVGERINIADAPEARLITSKTVDGIGTIITEIRNRIDEAGFCRLSDLYAFPEVKITPSAEDWEYGWDKEDKDGFHSDPVLGGTKVGQWMLITPKPHHVGNN